jgi:hypothetical protein
MKNPCARKGGGVREVQRGWLGRGGWDIGAGEVG